MIFFPLTPVYHLFLNPSPASLIFYLGAFVSLYGIYKEGISDRDLESFKRMKSEGLLKDKSICDFGDWKYSRHPNIFFEVVTWTGIAMMALHPSRGIFNLVPLFGPWMLYLIVKKLTLPLTESCMKRKRPNWEKDIRGTNLLNPYWASATQLD